MTILVTGGTGSFGQAFVRKALGQSTYKRVVVYSRDELKQYQMRRALEAEFPGETERLRFFLGDIRDENRLYRGLRGIRFVVHAAALKQVDTLEYNPAEAVKTNILGAMNLIEAAIAAGVERVLALSSDKATAPLNLYGKTKAVMESLLVQGNVYSLATRFSCVRYGNVFDSRGSVVPLWREQAKTGSLTMTDPDMTRYLITLPQAVDFVSSCLNAMQGGEVFVPKLSSCRIGDLANLLAPDAEWQVTGLRPGEKKHEALISPDEARMVREFPDRYIIYPAIRDWPMTIYGTPVAEGFSYSSSQNAMSGGELKEWLMSLPS